MACLRLVRAYLPPPYVVFKFTSQGPISESDFFTWEALICGPKDTPFVSCLLRAVVRYG